jgi:hypothetical protein
MATGKHKRGTPKLRSYISVADFFPSKHALGQTAGFVSGTLFHRKASCRILPFKNYSIV